MRRRGARIPLKRMGRKRRTKPRKHCKRFLRRAALLIVLAAVLTVCALAADAEAATPAEFYSALEQNLKAQKGNFSIAYTGDRQELGLPENDALGPVLRNMSARSEDGPDNADYPALNLSLIHIFNNTYLAELFDGIPCEEEDVIAYFDAHAEEFAAQGLSRDDPNMVNVRHILIQPAADQDAETDENGSPVLTEQNWTDAEIKA